MMMIMIYDDGLSCRSVSWVVDLRGHFERGAYGFFCVDEQWRLYFLGGIKVLGSTLAAGRRGAFESGGHSPSLREHRYAQDS